MVDRIAVRCFSLSASVIGLSMKPGATQFTVTSRVATSAAMFFRQMGGTLGTAVFLSVLFGTVAGNIAERLRGAGVRPQGGLSIDDTSYLSRLPDAVADPIRAGFAHSMDLVFLIGLAMIYAATGTLNMAELSVRLGDVPSGTRSA